MREACPEQYGLEHFQNVLRTFSGSPCRSPGGGISGPALGFSRLHEAYVNAIRTPIVLRTFFLCSKTIFGSKTFSGRVYSPAGTVSRCSNLPPLILYVLWKTQRGWPIRGSRLPPPPPLVPQEEARRPTADRQGTTTGDDDDVNQRGTHGPSDNMKCVPPLA